MAKIEIKVSDKKVAAALAEMQHAAESQRALLEVVGRKVANRVRLGFRSGTAPNGQRWKPLRFREGEPLRDTKRLNNSITTRLGDDYVDVGTNVKYGPVHQFGAVIRPKPGFWATHSKAGPGRRPKMLVFKGPHGLVFAKQVTIPARPFLPLDRAGNVSLPPDWGADVLSALRRHFDVVK